MFAKNCKIGYKTVKDNRKFTPFPPELHVPNTPCSSTCPVVSSLAGGRTGGTALVFLVFSLQPLREPLSLYDSPFVCAVAEREAVCAHHSCRAKLLL